MKKMRVLVGVLALLLLSSGCLVVERHVRPHKARGRCHPSQFWDGNRCVHKGKGHGARKHDGGGHPGKGKKHGKKHK